jgi:hypothetical protein
MRVAGDAYDNASPFNGDRERAGIGRFGSAVVSFGALGLKRPDLPQGESNAFYTAGKWLAAVNTVGRL